MKTLLSVFVLACLGLSISSAQTSPVDATEKARKDSIATAKAVEDSIKMEKLFAIAQYPYVKGSKWSGLIPVTDPTEKPDPNQDYKLLFDVTAKNPDSLAKDINTGLDEVARVMNLHFASGIPAKRILPVIVLHGGGVEAALNNDAYRKQHSIDNPNIKLIQDLENAGATISVCGQSMAFHDLKKDDLLPGIKVSLTAQTVLSNYQLQGYVPYSIKSDR